MLEPQTGNHVDSWRAQRLLEEMANQLAATSDGQAISVSRDFLRRVEAMQVELLGHIRSREQQLERVQRHALRLRGELDAIYGSVTWRASEGLRRRILRLGPQGTKGYGYLMRVRSRLLRDRPATGTTAVAQRLETNDQAWLRMPEDPSVRERIASAFDRIRGATGRTRIVAIKSGGIGDNVQAIPVLAGIRRRHPDAVILILAERAASIFVGCPFVDASISLGRVDQRVKVRSALPAANLIYDIRYVSWAYGDDREVSSYARENRWLYDLWPQSSTRLDILSEHVTQIMLKSFGMEDIASLDDMRVCPQQTSLLSSIGRPYLVVNNAVDSSVGSLKKWSEDEWLKVISALVKKRYAVVQLGARTDLLLSPLVTDLRGRTNLREAAYILKGAAGYVGVEGGLFHLAHAVGTRGFVIFASTPPACFSYDDTVILSRDACPACWWHPGWEQGVCSRGVARCLNLPSAEEVVAALDENGI